MVAAAAMIVILRWFDKTLFQHKAFLRAVFAV